MVDIQGKRVLAFRLQPNGKYQQCAISEAIALRARYAIGGLPIELLSQTLSRLESDNFAAAIWFAQQIANM